MNFELLVIVGAIFLLSLVGAFVLFKFLQSTAVIERKGYQAVSRCWLRPSAVSVSVSANRSD